MRVSEPSDFVLLASLVGRPPRLGGFDIPVLPPLRPAADQDDQPVAIPTEIDRYPGPLSIRYSSTPSPTLLTFDTAPRAIRVTATVTLAAATGARESNQSPNALNPEWSRYSSISTACGNIYVTVIQWNP
jgi:hypothetical protein